MSVSPCTRRARPRYAFVSGAFTEKNKLTGKVEKLKKKKQITFLTSLLTRQCVGYFCAGTRGTHRTRAAVSNPPAAAGRTDGVRAEALSSPAAALLCADLHSKLVPSPPHQRFLPPRKWKATRVPLPPRKTLVATETTPSTARRR